MKIFGINYKSIIVGENFLVLIWKDETGAFNDEKFKKEALDFKKYVLKYKPEGIVVDLTHFDFKISPELAEWRNKNVVSAYKEIGLKRFAFVTADKDTIKQPALGNSRDTFETRYFTDIYDAQEWVSMR